MPTILKLSNLEAREYFLKENHYVNFDLPPYITFSEILTKVSEELGDKPISSYFKQPDDSEAISTVLNPKDIENVNYKLISNKDGEFAWRPFEIIHPALYVALLHDLTQEDNWKFLTDKFGEFRKSVVLCESIPFKSEDGEMSDKAAQVRRWWTNVEQASLRTALKFQHVFDVDVADCYGSIYTHSIAWALHGKEFMKQRSNRNETKLLGNRIDWLIQKMRYGQTNGIPQGSSLMDFIAEIILGYVDLQLTERLSEVSRNDFAITRFRDDYKVFTNKPDLGYQIVKDLSEIFSALGMKLNTNKTKQLNDPILASIKTDKVYELFIPNRELSLSKWIVQIYAATVKYPNSGMVTRLLDKYYKELEKSKELGKYDDVSVMISIVTNIAINSPRTYQWSMAIISKLLDFCTDTEKVETIKEIQERFKRVPNTGLLDIWLQRVSYKIDPEIKYNERLTKIVSEDYATNVIWASGWLTDKLRSIVSNTSIVDRDKIESMSPVIPKEEVALFNPMILS